MTAPAPARGLAWNDVAAATRCNPQSVLLHWPVIVAELERVGIGQTLVQVAAAATVAIETAGTFKPIREYASGKAYDVGKLAQRLGNTPEDDGDGERYKGRGFIQITGTTNYRTYGERLGVDLLGNPDLALDPIIAARILALYFRDRGVDDAALRKDWPRVRKLVNGGYNHYEPFKLAVDRLLKARGL